jgi:hypothetical protein
VKSTTSGIHQVRLAEFPGLAWMQAEAFASYRESGNQRTGVSVRCTAIASLAVVSLTFATFVLSREAWTEGVAVLVLRRQRSARNTLAQVAIVLTLIVVILALALLTRTSLLAAVFAIAIDIIMLLWVIIGGVIVLRRQTRSRLPGHEKDVRQAKATPLTLIIASSLAQPVGQTGHGFALALEVLADAPPPYRLMVIAATERLANIYQKRYQMTRVESGSRVLIRDIGTEPVTI